MKHVKLGNLDVGRIGLGAMGMSTAFTGAGQDDAESIRTIHRALDLGVTLIDTAEIYGPFVNETLVGRAIDQAGPGRPRHEVRHGSHAGGGPGHLDSSPANIRTAVEGSLKQLGTDHIDLYYQHRVDPDTPDRGYGRCPFRTPSSGKDPIHRLVRGLDRYGSAGAPTPCTP